MKRNSPERRSRTARIQRVLLGILAANLLVVAAKAVIGAAAGSLAVLSDAVHSSLDAFNNVMALVVIRLAAREPDEEHPYGHRKFETLGALGIVVLMSIGCFELVKGAVTRLLAGTAPLRMSDLQFAMLAVTLVINVVVALYESRRGRELGSDLLLADAAHTKADVFVTTGVLTGVLLSRSGQPFWDPVVALLVAVVIVVVAVGVVRRSVPVLVDEHVVAAERIREVAEGVAGIRSAYHIRSRRGPDERFAELTIAVSRKATVEAAHAMADQVETRLEEQLNLSQVVIHIEPC